jgi:hypothetical protein
LDSLDAWWYFDSTSFPWLLSQGSPPFNFFLDLTIVTRRAGGEGVPFLYQGRGGGGYPFHKEFQFFIEFDVLV